MNEPLTLDAGTTASWSFLDDRADGINAFTYLLRGPGVIDIEATAENGEVSVSVPSTTTADWPAGLYEWRLHLSEDGDVTCIGEGRVTIRPDFSSQGAGYDPRTHARKMLDAINALLEGRVVVDAEKYSIDGRSLDRIPINELHRLRRIYLRKVAIEDGNTASLTPRRILTRLPG